VIFITEINMDQHVLRARRWISTLDSIECATQRDFDLLTINEYVLTLCSFLRQLLKHPEASVQQIHDKEIPVGNTYMTIYFLLVTTPRQKLYEIMDQLVAFNGDVDAAIASDACEKKLQII
tara:strand:- start:714 stop:1076 length:363 start_codon:yes stop_codon:yes gene_type:complete